MYYENEKVFEEVCKYYPSSDSGPDTLATRINLGVVTDNIIKEKAIFSILI